jgi:hypothetical protein
MKTATGTFEVKITPKQPADGEESSVGRMTIDKQFHGELEGTSKGQMLAHRTATKGSAGYVAMERVTGTLDGRNGSFVLQHDGTMDRGTPSLTVKVVPDSGTDGLTGLAGTLEIVIEGEQHGYVLTYSLP